MEAPQAVLAIDLRQHSPRVGADLESCTCSCRFNLPCPIGTGAGIERERDGRASGLLDIPAKIEAMLRVEASLVAAPCVLIENIRETDTVEKSSGRETKEYAPVGRLAYDATQNDPIVSHVQSPTAYLALNGCNYRIGVVQNSRAHLTFSLALSAFTQASIFPSSYTHFDWRLFSDATNAPSLAESVMTSRNFTSRRYST